MQIERAREQYLRWLLVTRDLSRHTIRAYREDLLAFQRHVGAGTLVQAIDGECLFTFMEALNAAKLSPASIRRRASGVRGFCRWLRLSGTVAEDPWTNVAVTLARARRLPKVLAAGELDRLVTFLLTSAEAAARKPADPLRKPYESTTLLGVAVMIMTGVRVHELVTIECHKIDLGSGSLRLLGKGRRERQVFLTNDWIIDLICAYLKTREAAGVGHPYLLFNSRRGPLTEAAMRARLSRAARDAGLANHVTPHMLRHSAATQLIEAGVDIRFVQRLLGHASLTTTELYTHVSDVALRRVVSTADILGGLLHVDN